MVQLPHRRSLEPGRLGDGGQFIDGWTAAGFSSRVPAWRVPAWTVTAETVPTERVPTERVPTERVPTERVPTERVPTERVPTERVPTERVSTERVPTERVPTERVRTRAEVFVPSQMEFGEEGPMPIPGTIWSWEDLRRVCRSMVNPLDPDSTNSLSSPSRLDSTPSYSLYPPQPRSSTMASTGADPVADLLPTVPDSVNPPLRRMAWPLDSALAERPGAIDRLRALKIEQLLDDNAVPVGDTTNQNLPTRQGVLRLTNIPYTVTRQEIYTFLGRGSNRPLNERMPLPKGPSAEGPSVHIIMERSTGKTMDCFVEFKTQKEAMDIVDRVSRSYEIGQPPRMGSRHVDIEISSPDIMMKALFPLAKCIQWVDGKPIKLPNTNSWSTGFDGFLTDEELFCLTRHAEQPNRSAFAIKVPQRCYECFISTLWKFPWHATGLYTVAQRNKLFHTLNDMIKFLVERIGRQNTVGLDRRLLTELVQAGLSCPAFNPRMKWNFVYYAQDREMVALLSRDFCINFPFDTLNYFNGRSAAEILYYSVVVKSGHVNVVPNRGLLHSRDNPLLKDLYGQNWLEWKKDTAEGLLFKDAVAFEYHIYRQFLITGYQHLRTVHPRRANPAAPHSPGNDSVSSERTVTNVGPRPTTTAPPSHRKPGTMNRPGQVDNHEFNREWNYPRAPDSNTDTSEASDSGLSAQTVLPYRPPHARHSAAGSNSRRLSGGPYHQSRLSASSNPGHQSRLSSASNPSQPRSYVPHTTARNIRSASYSYIQNPGMVQMYPRAQSDSTRDQVQLHEDLLDEMLAAIDALEHY